MKSFEGFKSEDTSVKKMLPAGCYVAAIKAVKVEGTEPEQVLKFAVDVIEGEFAGFYSRLYDQQTAQPNLQYQPKFKGTFTLNIPNSANVKRTTEWDIRTFNRTIYAIEQSNAGYHWDWNEAGLAGKVVGINVREGTFNGNTFTQIGRFEVADDVRKGLCKVMPPKKPSGTVETAEAKPIPVADIEIPF